MITVAQAVKRKLSEDSFAMEAIAQKVLNNRAYAKIIKKDIEELTMKPVTIGSIVVALTRLKDQVRRSDFLPTIELKSFKVVSALSEITYNASSLEASTIPLIRQKVSSDDFLSTTQGGHELTIICPTSAKGNVLKTIEAQPKVAIDNLVAVSVCFSERYMEVPNTIYSLVRALAIRKINVIEIVSTYTELTFVVKNEELERTIHALNLYSRY